MPMFCFSYAAISFRFMFHRLSTLIESARMRARKYRNRKKMRFARATSGETKITCSMQITAPGGSIDQSLGNARVSSDYSVKYRDNPCCWMRTNENESRFVSVCPSVCLSNARHFHHEPSKKKNRFLLGATSTHARKGSTNSNMGQCTDSSFEERKSIRFCVARAPPSSHTRTSHNKTSNASRVHIDRPNGRDGMGSRSILSKCQRFWSHWRKRHRISFAWNSTQGMCVLNAAGSVLFFSQFSFFFRGNVWRSHSDTHTNAHGKWQTVFSFTEKHTWNCFARAPVKCALILNECALCAATAAAADYTEHKLSYGIVRHQILSFQTLGEREIFCFGFRDFY